MNNRIKVKKVEVLSDDWYVLKKTTFDYLRNDGQWQTMSRETYDRGNGATILLYNLQKQTIILTRQFRYPVFVNDHPDGYLIEAAAGLLDKKHPEERIKAEVYEETGYRVNKVTPIFEAYMSPGSVTEKLHFFIAEYSDQSKKNEGGGVLVEGEDIEVLEMSITDAFDKTQSGDIQDGKTIMLIQYAALNVFKNINFSER